jgi:hypothetical protein
MSKNSIITVNSLPALKAMKFWLLREKHRHEQDIKAIEIDLEKLSDVALPEIVMEQLDCWFEIPSKEKKC